VSCSEAADFGWGGFALPFAWRGVLLGFEEVDADDEPPFFADCFAG
jgi:hypothetical protein